MKVVLSHLSQVKFDCFGIRLLSFLFNNKNHTSSVTAKASLEIKHFVEEKESLISDSIKVFFFFLNLYFFIAGGFRTTGLCCWMYCSGSFKVLRQFKTSMHFFITDKLKGFLKVSLLIHGKLESSSFTYLPQLQQVSISNWPLKDSARNSLHFSYLEIDCKFYGNFSCELFISSRSHLHFNTFCCSLFVCPRNTKFMVAVNEADHCSFL